eukprot:Blabericola_migrator_1__74@NODE_1019_length_5676_cov_15_746835_g700_i0_p2_GENE_NODE_1019_length_5676_cov_15_746835_g700_i0NODE_1019_length_5676_cov_15_746835_g700_i0_p2_ORF_typecomplete_len174_score1_60_NODE_1019_length_5676_cov_15_746835_g700_i0275796
MTYWRISWRASVVGGQCCHLFDPGHGPPWAQPSRTHLERKIVDFCRDSGRSRGVLRASEWLAELCQWREVFGAVMVDADDAYSIDCRCSQGPSVQLLVKLVMTDSQGMTSAPVWKQQLRAVHLRKVLNHTKLPTNASDDIVRNRAGSTADLHRKIPLSGQNVVVLRCVQLSVD